MDILHFTTINQFVLLLVVTIFVTKLNKVLKAKILAFISLFYLAFSIVGMCSFSFSIADWQIIGENLKPFALHALISTGIIGILQSAALESKD